MVRNMATNPRWFFIPIAIFAILAVSFFIVHARQPEQTGGVTHRITMKAVNLPSGELAYQMFSHKIESTDKTSDVTDRYSREPTIPGPAIVISEGDKVEVSLQHAIVTSSEQP